MSERKKFLIIGNMNAVTYREVFPYIKDNELWLGTQYVKEFVDDYGNVKAFGNVLWYTNLMHKKRNVPLDLYKHYNEAEYPKYYNCNGINVDKVSDIPMDYDGIMGVPLTLLDKYCPSQFEIVGCADADILPDGWVGMNKEFVDLYYAQGNTGQYKEGNRLACYLTKDGKAKVPYKRILIRHILNN